MPTLRRIVIVLPPTGSPPKRVKLTPAHLPAMPELKGTRLDRLGALDLPS